MLNLLFTFFSSIMSTDTGADMVK